ncbi:TPA: hypothetical protein JG851_004777 [Vibrio parahaemolyticus]|nr:hypothetical protein [Vibrio parahaemolyticus]HBB9976770.1 hypothetical protein [Vibrio parahaemolyticus]HBC0013334.1 hypothetical protein [Vibrio parahaemolyticus]
MSASEDDVIKVNVKAPRPEMDPKSHRELRKEYLLRFGEDTWGNAYQRLKATGYIHDLKVTLPVDVPGQGKEQTTLIRSAASYKQLTPLFFEQFKVTQFDNVKKLIQKRHRQAKTARLPL